ncbi:MAG: malate dehydrogenase [Merismopedia sp. SIO2A8]|nr:malate dehydrogenase [Merismopedia sp. SIO2A8]
MAASLSALSPQSPRVSIIGAGNVGATLALRIVERNLADVVLLDIVPGRPQGMALDMMQARGVAGHDRQIVGTNDYEDTADASIIVITAGLPRKPGMSRDDLLRTNAKIVVEATQRAIAHSPNAILILVTNPLDVITYLAWKASGLPTHRVMGMAGILDSARFQTFIAMELGVSTGDIQAMVLGSHGDLMVPLPQYSTVSGIPITQLMDQVTIERLVERTRKGGAEVVGLLKTGGAYYAPSAAICQMIEAILCDRPRLLPIAAYLNGEYGLHDLFIGVPVRLGATGIESVMELSLTNAEQNALHQSATSVRDNTKHILDFLEL